MTTIVVGRERVALDLLLWRRFGMDGASMLEATYELNPGLADLGVILPIGTEVTLPDFAMTAEQAVVPVISLFG